MEAVEEAAPDVGAEHTGGKGYEDHEYGDGLVGGIDPVVGVGEVFDADGQGDEVTEAEEHPTEEEVAEESVFPDEAEILPGVAYVFCAEWFAGDAVENPCGQQCGNGHDDKDPAVVIDLLVEKLTGNPGEEYSAEGDEDKGGGDPLAALVG